MVLTIVAFVIVAILLLLLWEDEWFGAPALRGFVVALVGLQLTEMLVVRTILVPFFQKIRRAANLLRSANSKPLMRFLTHCRCGPALFMCELWYLNSGFVKG